MVNKIREKFPSPDGIYTGFKENEEEKEIESSESELCLGIRAIICSSNKCKCCKYVKFKKYIKIYKELV